MAVWIPSIVMALVGILILLAYILLNPQRTLEQLRRWSIWFVPIGVALIVIAVVFAIDRPDLAERRPVTIESPSTAMTVPTPVGLRAVLAVPITSPTPGCH